MDVQAGFFQIRTRRFFSIQPAICSEAATWTQSPERSMILTSRPGLTLKSTVLSSPGPLRSWEPSAPDDGDVAAPQGGRAAEVIGADAGGQQQGERQGVERFFVPAPGLQQEKAGVQQRTRQQQQDAQAVQGQLALQQLDGARHEIGFGPG